MPNIDLGEWVPQGPPKEVVEKQRERLEKARELAEAITMGRVRWLETLMREHGIDLIEDRLSAPWGDFYLIDAVEKAEAEGMELIDALQECVSTFIDEDEEW